MSEVLPCYYSKMPTVIKIGHFRFHFYSDEGSEPPHIHVRSPDGECKFWLEPTIFLASNRGISPHELRNVEKLVYENQDLLRTAYHEFHHR
jgi:hypothetical protein